MQKSGLFGHFSVKLLQFSVGSRPSAKCGSPVHPYPEIRGVGRGGGAVSNFFFGFSGLSLVKHKAGGSPWAHKCAISHCLSENEASILRENEVNPKDEILILLRLLKRLYDDY